MTAGDHQLFDPDRPITGAVGSRHPDPTTERPGLHRRQGPDTSVAAAHRSAPASATQRGYLLQLFGEAGDRGLTAHEAEALMIARFPRMRTVRPRLVELRDDGWVVTTDATRLTDSGSPAHVSILNPDAAEDFARWLNDQNLEVPR